MEFNENLKNFLDHIHSLAKTETVIGEQFQLGEFTVIPIIKVGIGLGSGYGKGSAQEKGSGEGGGLGGGIGIEPIAFLTVKGGEMDLLNIGKSKIPEGILDKIPDIIGKVSEMTKKKKEADDKE